MKALMPQCTFINRLKYFILTRVLVRIKGILSTRLYIYSIPTYYVKNVISDSTMYLFLDIMKYLISPRAFFGLSTFIFGTCNCYHFEWKVIIDK